MVIFSSFLLTSILLSTQLKATRAECDYNTNTITLTAPQRPCNCSQFPDLFNATIGELQFGLSCGTFSSTSLVKAYLARIEEVNLRGPALRAVIETNPSALKAAEEADILRKWGTRGPLHGIPIILKDNIATRAEDGMNTTSGSYALLNSIVQDDATITRKLRDAGAIIIGKASLTEWSAFRGGDRNGWSGRGGQATSAFYPGGDACGSSTGSGISASIGLVPAAIGTDTDGSIICPSNRNNLVGIRPSVGLTSRYLVIPISQSQDTVGPMAKTVTDVATILNVIAGPDPHDNFTLTQPLPVPDYTQHLRKDALKGARIGVHYSSPPNAPNADYKAQTLSRIVQTIFKPLGANVLNDINLEDASDIAAVAGKNEFTVVFTHEFKYGINKYLSALKKVPTNATTLAGLIKFNTDHPKLELPPGHDNQDSNIAAERTTGIDDPAYISALKTNHDLGGTRGIDATLKKYNLDAIIQVADGDTQPAAIAGYPMITVPLGFLPENTPIPNGNIPLYTYPNMPFGIAFIGTKWSEARLIELAYSYEQAINIQSQGKPFVRPKTQLKDTVSGSEGVCIDAERA